MRSPLSVTVASGVGASSSFSSELSLPDEPGDSVHSKPARSFAALPDQIGRYGTRVGRAVHGVVQMVALDHPLDDLLAELDSLDLDTDLDDAVVVVEWGEGLAERLSERHLDVRLDRAADSEVRTATWCWSRG